MKKQAYTQTHQPLDQAFRVFPVSLLDLRLLFLPAALEDQVSHKCLHLPVEAARKEIRYITLFWYSKNRVSMEQIFEYK